MKILFIPLLFVALISKAQHSFPTYPTILKKFFNEYSYVQSDGTEDLQFAKTKEGWYVNITDLYQDTIVEKQLFWSAATGKYEDLLLFGDPGSKEEKSSSIDKHILQSSYGFYGFERSPYYGYAGWDIDVIRDFGNRDLSSLSDTLLDGLARAYSAYSSRFLWYQYGGAIRTDDSLQKTLAPAQLPSRRRADSSRQYIKKAIEVYSYLSERNNSYRTMVGNAGMKKFNEQVHGFLQMSLAGMDDWAKDFINEIEPNSGITKLAKNYLNSCAPNSIIITSGDNDTYPLLYVQQSQNFRKDITVLNVSLLGLPAYIDMIKRKKHVAFSTAYKSYADPSFSYFLFSEDENVKTDAKFSLNQFLQAIQSKRYTLPGMDKPVITYPVKNIVFNVDLNRFRKLTNQANLTNKIEFVLRDYYLTLDNFMILDIINSNFYSRPIYFTYVPPPFLEYAQLEGLAYRLLPLNKDKSVSEAISLNKTSAYLSKYFQPVLSTDLSSGVAPAEGMDGSIYMMHLKLVENYLEVNEKEKARQAVGKMYAIFNNQLSFDHNLKDLGFLLIRMGDKTRGLKVLEDYVEEMYRMMKNPVASELYISSSTSTSIADQIIEELKETNLSSRKIETILMQIHNQK